MSFFYLSVQTRKCIVKSFLLIATALLQSSCASKLEGNESLIISREIFSASEDRVFNQKNLQQDLKVLEAAIRDAYIGRYFHAEDVYEALVSDVKSLGSYTNIRSRSETVENIKKVFAKVPDGHLQIHEVTSSAPRKKAYFVTEGDIYNQLTMTSFPVLNSLKTDEFLKIYRALLQDKKPLILDFRFNSGGDLALAQKMLSYLWVDNPNFPSSGYLFFSLYDLVSFDLYSPEAVQLKTNWNTLSFLISSGDGRWEDSFHFYARAKYGDDSHKPEGLVGDLMGRKLKSLKLKKSVRKIPDVYVLLGQGCYSACEFFALNAVKHSSVETIGENSGGIFHFGNPGIVYLSSLNAYASIPTSYIKFAGNLNIETVGVRPSILADDALKKSIDLITKKY